MRGRGEREEGGGGGAADVFGPSGMGTFIHHQEVKCNPGRECKVDEWPVTSRNETIHHFLKLSSLKHDLCRYIRICGRTCLLLRTIPFRFSSRQHRCIRIITDKHN